MFVNEISAEGSLERKIQCCNVTNGKRVCLFNDRFEWVLRSVLAEDAHSHRSVNDRVEWIMSILARATVPKLHLSIDWTTLCVDQALRLIDRRIFKGPGAQAATLDEESKALCCRAPVLDRRTPVFVTLIVVRIVGDVIVAILKLHLRLDRRGFKLSSRRGH